MVARGKETVTITGEGKYFEGSFLVGSEGHHPSLLSKANDAGVRLMLLRQWQ